MTLDPVRDALRRREPEAKSVSVHDIYYRSDTDSSVARVSFDGGPTRLEMFAGRDLYDKWGELVAVNTRELALQLAEVRDYQELHGLELDKTEFPPHGMPPTEMERRLTEAEWRASTAVRRLSEERKRCEKWQERALEAERRLEALGHGREVE